VALGRQTSKKDDAFTLSTMGGGNDLASVDVIEHLNMLLQTVFSIFCRLSLNQESEEHKFP